MATKSIPISEATATQLATYGSVYMGLDVNHRLGVDKLRAALAAAGHADDFITVEDDIAPFAPTADPRKMVTIRIPGQSGPGGKDPVPVGVNGKFYRIMRDKDVDVPVEVLGVLNDAQVVEFDKGPNNEPINPRFVPKHPVSVIKAA